MIRGILLPRLDPPASGVPLRWPRGLEWVGVWVHYCIVMVFWPLPVGCAWVSVLASVLIRTE